MHHLPPSSSHLRLESHETLLAAARTGTWLQVRSGVLLVQPPPRWLGECMVAPAHRLGPGAGLLVGEDGWWRFVADHGPVELHCVRAVDRPASRWVVRGLARARTALREITRRLRPT